VADVVYVIGPEGSQTVKIGFSNKSRRRLREIQMMSPLPLAVLWSHPGRNDLENALHGRFRKYRSHGEWFTFPPHLPPVQTIRNATEALQYTAGDSGVVQPWHDAPICSEENRQHWLNRRLREAFGYQPFTLAEAAPSIGAPLGFVERYGARLASAGSLVAQTATAPRATVYVMQWLEGDRYALMGPAERTSAME
jgi:hypothetical protein